MRIGDGQEVGQGRNGGTMYKACGVFFWGDETVLELEVVGAQCCEYTKYH